MKEFFAARVAKYVTKIEKSVKIRWMLKVFVVTAIVLLVSAGHVLYLVCSRNYKAVEATLRARNTDVVDTFFSNYSTGGERFRDGARIYAESFQYRDTMDVWVLDKDGGAIVSSGGYDVQSYSGFPDYNAACASEEKTAVKRVDMPWGERAMSLCYVLTDESGNEYGAVRYIISLKYINRQMFLVGFTITLGYILVLLLIANSGAYFVSSIVTPVNQINSAAKKMAKGDFSMRIDVRHYNDEIGELCETINDMAQQIGQTDRLKNEFISTVSHEIRTPLTAIKGWAETLNGMGTADELTQKGLDIIISETSRLSGMVEDLLDFSRMQNGELKVKKEKVDVLAQLEKAYLTYLPKAQRENKALELHLSDTQLYFVNGDSGRICQVFINVIDNAVKYTDEGGKIDISVEKFGNYVRIKVEDNGCGISEEDIGRVKEKFFKANDSVHGTGIGLAVADEVVKKHSGSLNISSKAGEGTTVEILLPLDSDTES